VAERYLWKSEEHHTSSSHLDVRCSISIKFCMMIEVVRAIISPRKLFLGPINSLAARGHRKFGWKHPHWGKLFIILSFIEIKQPCLADLCRLRTRIKPVNFCKNCAGDPPLRGYYIGKNSNFLKFLSLNPHPWSDQDEIWQRGPLLQPNFTLIGATCRPYGAKNPKIGPWVKAIVAEMPFSRSCR